MFTARKRSLVQGNVFTGVCPQEGGWLPSIHHRSHDQGRSALGGLHPGGLGRPPRDIWYSMGFSQPASDTRINELNGQTLDMYLIIVSRVPPTQCMKVITLTMTFVFDS